MKMPAFSKDLAVDNPESKNMVIIGVAVAVTMFCLVGSKQLLSQASYQRKVINVHNATLKQLKENLTSANDLNQRYQVFNSTNPNIIGGKNTTSDDAAPPDGDNARIVLDALPSKYDFPALISSAYKIMANNGIASPAVTAIDQGTTINQAPTADPKPTAITLTLAGTGKYRSVVALIKDLEKSVRPFDVTNVQLTGSDNGMTFTLAANTYFQPAMSLDITTKEIK